MERRVIQLRPWWKQKVESLGFAFHTIEGKTYWDESACYRFTATEIDVLEAATEELNRICLLAVAHVIEQRLFSRLRIPAIAVPLIERSWASRERSMYGRFDICWDGSGPPKLLEYNADTPTSLLESSVVQWFWMKDVVPNADQYNSIHEKLIDYWKRLRPSGLVHFGCVKNNEEDLGTVEYVRDVAHQAGCDTRLIFVEDIGWDASSGQFVDLELAPIQTLFKLYPWEWLFDEQFGKHLERVAWHVIEPTWKAVLSNKGILAILWEMFPDHDYLLPAYLEPRFADDYVRKPLFSREGANVTLYRHGSVVAQPGTYGKEGHVYQQYAPMASSQGRSVSLGAWVVDGQPAGLGVREDATEITTNASRFVPHYFEEN